MATINIGNLTFTHKGDYDGSTAYAKNDVVYYSTNGNAYIAKQATTGNVPTNATYWNQFAQGSGGIWNAGLSLGSAGQVVKVNSGANALEFGDAGGTVEKITNFGDSTRVNLSDSANTALKTYTFTKSKDASTSYILVEGIFPIRGYSSDGCGIYFTCNSLASTHKEDTNDSHAFKGIGTSAGANASQTGFMVVRKVFNGDLHTGTDLAVGSHTLELGWKVRNSATGNKPFNQINFNSSDDARFHQSASEITVVEILK